MNTTATAPEATMTAAALTIRWTRDAETGERAAFIDGKQVARCEVNESVGTGYWNRYRGSVLGNRRVYATTLTEFKGIVAATAAQHAAEGILDAFRGY
jgi:hypothetical protein